MDYGFRRYETFNRLLWFVFFLLCALFAYPFARTYWTEIPPLPDLDALLKNADFGSLGFWMQKQWVHVGALGKPIVYLVWVAAIFLIFRLGGLIVQYVGKVFLERELESVSSGWHSNEGENGESQSPGAIAASYRDELLPAVTRTPHRYLFHAYQRVSWMLGGKQGGGPYSNDLLTREQRLVEADWLIHQSSWEPFLWVLRALPFLALLQTFWVFYVQLEPIIEGEKDINQVIGMVLYSLIPFVQIVALTVVFQIAQGLVRRLDNLYLANVDAMIYDHLLSKLPLRSSDTVLLIRTMRQEFRRIHETLERLEARMKSGGQ